MPATMLRPFATSDLPSILALNNSHATELGMLDGNALQSLLAEAFHARIAGECEGFLIALEQGRDYASPNYRWFCKRLERFVYIDRVAVAQTARRRGLGRQLYEDLFAAARIAGRRKIACEVNCDPPNPLSDRFHERIGFVEIGRARLPDRGKAVRYLLHSLSQKCERA